MVYDELYKHVLAVELTVIVATIGKLLVFVAINPGMFPLPLAPKPIAGFEFDQKNVAPVTELTRL